MNSDFRSQCDSSSRPTSPVSPAWRVLSSPVARSSLGWRLTNLYYLSHLYKAHLLSWLEVFFIICHKSSDMSHVQSLLEVTNCFIICHIIFYFIICHTSVPCHFLKFAISFTFIAISEVKSHKSCYMSPS